MKTTAIANNQDAILAHLDTLDNDELVNYHNIYARKNASDDEIYNNDEDFFLTFFGSKIMDAIRAISYGEYKYNDDYVMFNGYANLESFDYPGGRIDKVSIASDIIENPENYDIELEECFELDGVLYEGTEDDAKESYNEYVQEIEDENEGVEDEDKQDIDNFGKWCSENIATID